MLVLLEVSIKRIDEHLLVITYVVLVEYSTAFRSKKDHISVRRIGKVLLLLLVVDR